jgi:hypothetical protein
VVGPDLSADEVKMSSNVDRNGLHCVEYFLTLFFGDFSVKLSLIRDVSVSILSGCEPGRVVEE